MLRTNKVSIIATDTLDLCFVRPLTKALILHVKHAPVLINMNYNHLNFRKPEIQLNDIGQKSIYSKQFSREEQP